MTASPSIDKAKRTRSSKTAYRQKPNLFNTELYRTQALNCAMGQLVTPMVYRKGEMRMELPKLNLSNGILWNKPGFRLEIQKVPRSSDRFLKVDDLNPQVGIKLALSRWQTFRIGWFFIWRSIFAKQPH